MESRELLGQGLGHGGPTTQGQGSGSMHHQTWELIAATMEVATSVGCGSTQQWVWRGGGWERAAADTTTAVGAHNIGHGDGRAVVRASCTTAAACKARRYEGIMHSGVGPHGVVVAHGCGGSASPGGA